MNKSNFYVYLHGFASGSRSHKALYLYDCMKALNIELQIPDLNQEDFFHLTMTRQLKQVEAMFPVSNISMTMIGSSLGGLSAVILGEKYLQIERLILLAPAFNFLLYWLPKLGNKQLQQWQESGYMSLYHYGEKRLLNIHYQFLVDCQQYSELSPQRSIPTLILHGRNDDVIPIQSSRDYAKTRPWVKLVELDSDHSLSNVMAEIWQEITLFCH